MGVRKVMVGPTSCHVGHRGYEPMTSIITPCSSHVHVKVMFVSNEMKLLQDLQRKNAESHWQGAKNDAKYWVRWHG